MLVRDASAGKSACDGCLEGVYMVVLVQGPLGNEEKFAVRHIEEFTIHRFRGLRDLKLEKLGQINLLVGDNNAGKTSVLEALSLFSDPLNWRRWSNIASSREAGVPNSLSIDERITWLFPQTKSLNDNDVLNVSSEIELSASGNISLEKLVAHYEQFSEVVQVRTPRFSGQGDDAYEEREREVKSIKVDVTAFVRNLQPSLSDGGFDDGNGIHENFVFSSNRPMSLSRKTGPALLPSQLITPASHRMSITPSQLWTDVVNAEAKSGAIELLQFFDKNIEDVDMILSAAERPTISIKHNILKRAPLSIFGDGLRRIFALAGAIPGARDGLLLVDEVEMSIHTRALEKSFSWLVNECVKNNVQLFVTTHSLEALDILLDACDQSVDLVAYRLLLDKDGIDTTRFDKEYLMQLRDELGVDMRW
jgi:hypothetical protein